MENMVFSGIRDSVRATAIRNNGEQTDGCKNVLDRAQVLRYDAEQAGLHRFDIGGYGDMEGRGGEHGVKVPMMIRDEYVIYIEKAYGVHWIHCDVKKWGKGVFKALLRDLNKVQLFIGETIFALFVDDKQEKFMRMFGFKFLRDVEKTGGEKTKVFERPLWAIL